MVNSVATVLFLFVLGVVIGLVVSALIILLVNSVITEDKTKRHKEMSDSIEEFNRKHGIGK